MPGDRKDPSSKSSKPTRREPASMLDLPLRGGRPAGAGEPGPGPKLRPETPASPPPLRQSPAKGRSPINRRKTATIGAALVIVGVLAYLLLRPDPPRAGFSADPWDVGSRLVGSAGENGELTVSNDGEKPMPVSGVTLTGQEATEFVIVTEDCTGRTLEPSQSCAIELRFEPGAMGTRQATLQIHAEMPDSPAQLAIRGVGVAPVLSAAQTRSVFDSTNVGTTSAPVDLAVTNGGTAPLTIRSVSLDGSGERDFQLTRNDCSKSTLEPNEACQLRVVFKPRAAGERQASISFESDSFKDEPALELIGKGIWTGAAFAVEPKALEFGKQLVGEAKRSLALQVTNRQGMSLGGLKIRLDDPGSAFRVAKQSCTGRSLAPGETCRIEVAFEAPAEGAFAGMLMIAQADVGELGIQLGAAGVSPRWSLDTDAIDFGSIRVDSSSQARQIALANDGSAGAEVVKVETAGTDAGSFAIAEDRCTKKVIEPGARCSLSVSVSPVRAGEHQAQLLLHTAAGDSPQRLRLAAQAVAPRLSVDREMLDFGTVHSTTQEQVQLTLSNRGTDVLRITEFLLEGQGVEQFKILGGSCQPQIDLPAGQQCSLQVGFAPLVEGRATARLKFEHDGISGPREMPLAGTGLPPPVPQLSVSVLRLDFGPQPVGQRSAIQSVTIRSGGTGKLEFRAFEVEGQNPSDFYVVPATCQAAPFLLPGTECGLGIRFVPQAGGSRSGTLVIRHNSGDGTSRIELQGEGLGGPS